MGGWRLQTNDKCGFLGSPLKTAPSRSDTHALRVTQDFLLYIYTELGFSYFFPKLAGGSKYAGCRSQEAGTSRTANRLMAARATRGKPAPGPGAAPDA